MVSLKSLEESFKNQSSKEWWGYNEEHEWIVLYWRTSGNREKSIRTFVRCCDWQTITVNIKEWGQPNFLHASVYLKSLRDPVKREAELNRLEEYRQQAPSKVMLEAHKQFLQSRNIKYQGVRSTTGKQHRVTNCWFCKGKLDNTVNVECVACNWILCHCGACGCSYSVNSLL